MIQLNKLITRFVVYSALLTQSLFAIIIESDRLETVFAHIGNPAETCVIFDIDNTLITPETMAGTDEWFSYYMSKYMGEGLSQERSLNKMLPIYYALQNKLPLITVEPQTTLVISKLQATPILTFALTSRSFPLMYRTIEQLLSLGINFLNSPVCPQQTAELLLPHIAWYMNGIVFCAQNDKGAALIHFLELNDLKPKTVIFVDDKRKYLESVEKALSAYPITFVGIRYNAADKKVAAFNPEQATREIEAILGHIPGVA